MKLITISAGQLAMEQYFADCAFRRIDPSRGMGYR